eukprot:TRINITY_DN635_c0_g1_i1.p1 TRINITY_DN635_c0_g1~~TRINITY_DN635_c0_g1_i1.p1  ORF type:complete len:389 (+),score=83.29 TRINITY_DN635_c0_g1_i1:31-1167(+)
MVRSDLPGLSAEFEEEFYPETLFCIARMRRPMSYRHLLFFIYLIFVGLPLLIFRLIVILFSEFIFLNIFKKLGLEDIFFKAYSNLLGIKYNLINPEQLYGHDSRIIVSNHCSEFDALLLRALLGSRMSIIAPRFYSKHILTKRLLEYLNPIFTEPKKEKKGHLHKILQDYVKDSNNPPLVLFPEGGLTNGRVGLMKYQKFTFSLGQKVLPLALRLRSPFRKVINLDHLTTPVTHNFFWLLAQPYLTYDVSVLEETEIQDDETELQFADRVQESTARKLGILATDIQVKHKYGLVRKYVTIKEQEDPFDSLGWRFGLGLINYDTAVDLYRRKNRRMRALSWIVRNPIAKPIAQSARVVTAILRPKNRGHIERNRVNKAE